MARPRCGSRAWILGGLSALIAALAAGTPHAGASRPLDVGFADILYETPSVSERWLQRTEQLNADIIRINLYWAYVAPTRPADPRDPGDPAYDWSRYDDAIRNASALGFDVEVTVFTAPRWAEGANRPSLAKARAGVWRPNAAAFGDFGAAVARRYSGTYDPGGGTLPFVRYFEAWNEPNLGSYIMPQYSGRKNVSAAIYGRMLNEFYAGVKSVDPKMQVVTGGTAPYGDDPSPKATKTHPLAFDRSLLCLSPKLRRGPCAAGDRVKFDVLAHHPINREDPPAAHADDPDDVEVADFGELTATLRKAEKLGTTGTAGRHALWANEVWWQTNPPDRDEGVSLETHARWTEQALYSLWIQGASKVLFLQFRDAKYRAGEATLDSYQTGVYAYDGKRKPTATAVAFPFVTDRLGRRTLRAWGVAPRSGRLVIEARESGRGWRRVARVDVREGRVFTRTLRGMSGSHSLRARVAGRSSLVWSQRG
jgi:hypothetical protein